MNRIVLLIAAVATGASVVAFTFLPSEHANERAAPAGESRMPSNYRDWKLISVAHEAGDLNDIRAILGNDAAVRAYREQKLPFKDGAIIARLAWNYVASEENNRVFGRDQSFVAGTPTNVQFMVRDSRKYAATGGWGFAQFTNGNPADEATPEACFSCHRAAKNRSYVFTHYSP